MAGLSLWHLLPHWEPKMWEKHLKILVGQTIQWDLFAPNEIVFLFVHSSALKYQEISGLLYDNIEFKIVTPELYNISNTYDHCFVLTAPKSEGELFNFQFKTYYDALQRSRSFQNFILKFGSQVFNHLSLFEKRFWEDGHLPMECFQKSADPSQAIPFHLTQEEDCLDFYFFESKVQIMGPNSDMILNPLMFFAVGFPNTLPSKQFRTDGPWIRVGFWLKSNSEGKYEVSRLIPYRSMNLIKGSEFALRTLYKGIQSPIPRTELPPALLGTPKTSLGALESHFLMQALAFFKVTPYQDLALALFGITTPSHLDLALIAEILTRCSLECQPISLTDLKIHNPTCLICQSKGSKIPFVFLYKTSEHWILEHHNGDQVIIAEGEISQYFENSALSLKPDLFSSHQTESEYLDDEDDDISEKKSKKIIKKILLKTIIDFLRQNKIFLVFALLFSLIMNILSLFIPLGINTLLQFAKPLGSETPFAQLAAGIFVVCVFISIFYYLLEYLVIICGSRFELLLNRRFFTALFQGNSQWIQEHGIGVFFEWFREIQRFHQLIFEKSFSIIKDLMGLLPLFLLLSFYDFSLALVLFMVIPVSFILYYIYRNYFRKSLDSAFQIGTTIHNRLLNDLGLFREIKAFNQEQSMRQKHENLILEQTNRRLVVEQSYNALHQMVELCFFSAFGVVMFLASRLMEAGKIGLGELVALCILTLKSQQQFVTVSQLYEVYRHGRTRVKRIVDMYLLLFDNGKSKNTFAYMDRILGKLSLQIKFKKSENHLNLQVFPGEKFIVYVDSPDDWNLILALKSHEPLPDFVELSVDDLKMEEMNPSLFRKSVSIVNGDTIEDLNTFSKILSESKPDSKPDLVDLLWKCGTKIMILIDTDTDLSVESKLDKAKHHLHLSTSNTFLIFTNRLDFTQKAAQEVSFLKIVKMNRPRLDEDLMPSPLEVVPG